MNKSYDRIMGDNKFCGIFAIIMGGLMCILLSFSLNEIIFSFDFKIYPQKILLFIIILALLLSGFYYFISQRRYKLLDEKLVYGANRRNILYSHINTLVFTLAASPKGIYNIGLYKPYLYMNERDGKRYISNIAIFLTEMKNMHKAYDEEIIDGNLGINPAYNFNCYDSMVITNLIHNSKAYIYVTRSFLFYNNWTINKFSAEYDIPIERVQLINDKIKQ